MTGTNASQTSLDLSISVPRQEKVLPTLIPTDRDLIANIAIAIATHPLVRNSTIVNPIDGSNVNIAKIKLYGGREITEPGLVLAVYPDMAALGDGNGSGYLREDQMALGAGNSRSSVPYLQAHLVVQLNYLLTDFDRVIKTAYLEKEFGNYYLRSSEENIDDLVDLKTQLKAIDLYVLPAEEILREWITLLRYVIRDIRFIHPFKIRNPQITSVEYSTAELFKKSNAADVALHHAKIRFKFNYSDVAI
jgi:hypothetical protein